LEIELGENIFGLLEATRKKETKRKGAGTLG